MLLTGTSNTGVVLGNASLFTSGIDNGNLVYCGVLTHFATSVANGNFIHDCDAFDFQDSCLFIGYWTTLFSGLASTGVASVSSGHYTLTGDANIEENVFNISGSDLAAIASLTINSGSGTFVIINIDGTVDVFSSFVTTLEGGIDVQHVIYNFFEATSLTIADIAVEVCAHSG